MEDGQLLLVGLAGGTLPVRPVVDEPPPLPFETSVAMSFWGTRAELQEVIALARSGQLRADMQTFPLARAPEASGAKVRAWISGSMNRSAGTAQSRSWTRSQSVTGRG